MELPAEIGEVLRRLEAAGYPAYLVGGCTRDSLLGRVPKDYDITTAALPAETEAVFRGERVIETGLRHGTVTVLLNGTPVEITTFRVDGAYSDGRHPDAVSFTPSLREDLARRDFTVNAVAWRPSEGYVDPFGGEEDIRRGIIRCVGEPERRFSEDALRVLRALRFAAELDFSVDEPTAAALLRCREGLKRVSPERISTELRKLLCGPAARRVLLACPEVLGTVIPELLPLVGLDQRNPYHCYDAWEHTAAAVEAVPPEPVLRLAALLHDVGKPDCFSLDAQGVGHFYGHPERGAEIADRVLRRLRFDNALRERVTLLVAKHDLPISSEKKTVRRLLNRLTPEVFFQLTALRRADLLAHAPEKRGQTAELDAMEAAARTLLLENSCFTLGSLALRGDDLRAAGMAPGPALGAALRRGLEAVMDGVVPNEKAALLALLREEGRLFP